MNIHYVDIESECKARCLLCWCLQTNSYSVIDNNNNNNNNNNMSGERLFTCPIHGIESNNNLVIL